MPYGDDFRNNIRMSLKAFKTLGTSTVLATIGGSRYFHEATYGLDRTKNLFGARFEAIGNYVLVVI